MYMFVQGRAFNIEKSVGRVPIGRVFSLLVFKVNSDEFLATNHPLSRYASMKIFDTIATRQLEFLTDNTRILDFSSATNT